MEKTSMITPDVREAIGSLLKQARAFKGAFDAFYQAIDTLGRACTSEDCIRFIACINSHKYAFDTMCRELEKAVFHFENHVERMSVVLTPPHM